MTDTWAAKVLEGVRRCHTPEGTYLHKDDALAAIAKLAEGDGLVERAGKYPEILMGYSQGDMDGVMALISRQALHETADTITDLLAHIAALTAQNREMALDVLASSGQAAEAYAAQLAAEAERDALTKRVARLEGELTNLPAVYAHQINTGVREVYDPLQRFYTMESVLIAIAEAQK